MLKNKKRLRCSLVFLPVGNPSKEQRAAKGKTRGSVKSHSIFHWYSSIYRWLILRVSFVCGLALFRPPWRARKAGRLTKGPQSSVCYVRDMSWIWIPSIFWVIVENFFLSRQWRFSRPFLRVPHPPFSLYLFYPMRIALPHDATPIFYRFPCNCFSHIYVCSVPALILLFASLKRTTILFQNFHLSVHLKVIILTLLSEYTILFSG